MKRKLYEPKDFAWTQWGPAEINQAVTEALEYKKRVYAKIKSLAAEERTFENTIAALDEANFLIDPQVNHVVILLNTSTSKELRDAAQKAIEEFEKTSIDIEYDEELYKAIKSYAEKGEQLEGSEKILLDDTLRAYRRMGFELDTTTREKLKELLKQLSELTLAFDKNINDFNESILVTSEQTHGLPEQYLATLPKDKKGNFIVAVNRPNYFAIMENAAAGDVRKAMEHVWLQRGGKKNIDILTNILSLRSQHAEILGYKDHIEYKTEPHMAKNGDTVKKFLRDLVEQLRPGVRNEISQITDLKQKRVNNPAAILESYDIRYYSNELKKERFFVDNEKVREYFPFDVVKKGIFHIYSALLSVTFEKLEGYPLWHEDVELYTVKNSERETLSYFALDLYPREAKYGHAAVFGMTHGRVELAANGEELYRAPIAAMIANFPKPTSEQPSLLNHEEVETFFHEFGHIVHNVLTEAKYLSQSGTNVARDFVEAPSQMLEHWVWDAEMLSILSGHYKNTGEKLPEELLKNLLASKLHMIAYDTMRQLTFGLYDITIHEKGYNGSVVETFNKIQEDLIGIPPLPNNLFPAGFGHLMGYDADYYGYLWSKVYATDMFTRFKKEGLLNPKTGTDYRNWILSKGSSMEEMDLARGFLGREPNNEAFLKEVGL